MYEPAEPLISVHVPKCAGTSLSQALAQWYGPQGFFTHYADEKANRPPPRQRLWTETGEPALPWPTCVHGHFNRLRGFGVRDYYPQARQQIIFLRNPLEMKVSNYFYVKQAAASGAVGASRAGAAHPIVAHDWSLEEFLCQDVKSFLLNFLPPDINAGNFREILEAEFLFVGLAEQFESGLHALAELLGFSPLAAPVENIALRDQPIGYRERTLFEEHNALEMAIYDHVARSLDVTGAGEVEA